MSEPTATTIERATAVNDPILEVDGLQRRFGGVVAVDIDHLAIARGSMTALIGPNGAGKTTVFNLLTGFDRPDAGTWTFDGVPLHRQPAHRVARAGMVRTFQLTKALPRLSVLDNVLLGANHAKGERFLEALGGRWRDSERERIEQAEALLEDVRLADKRDDDAATLSGGQRKLLELARALMAGPKLLMLDEPMAGVNPALAEFLVDRLLALRGAGITILFIEHELDVVMATADRVVCMAGGSIISTGTPAQVLRDPEVAEAYLGVRQTERIRHRDERDDERDDEAPS
jgi:branched-chain amino acid transport system ATP-binding protein